MIAPQQKHVCNGTNMDLGNSYYINVDSRFCNCNMIVAQQKHVRNWNNMDGGTGMYSVMIE